jgi:2'-5' RNA ligase
MSDGIMIAYLPTDGSWCKQPLPHMTLVYAGTLADHDYTAFNQLAKDAISISRLTGGFELNVTGVETFGEDPEQVEVLTLSSTPELIRARELVEHWNKSSHGDFKPHCTVGPLGSARGILPTSLYFDRIMVAFGNEDMTFRLGGSESAMARDRY